MKREPNFSFAGLKAQQDEFGGRILLGENMGCGTIVLAADRGAVCWGWVFNCISSSTTCILIPSSTEFDFRWAFRNPYIPLIRRVSCGHVTAVGGEGEEGYEVVCLNDGHSGSVSLSNNEEMKIGLKLI